MPVKIGDLIVSSGDYVIADRSAVIIVLQAEIGCVLAAAERIAAKEEEMAKQIRAGRPIGTVMGGLRAAVGPLTSDFKFVSLRSGGGSGWHFGLRQGCTRGSSGSNGPATSSQSRSYPHRTQTCPYMIFGKDRTLLRRMSSVADSVVKVVFHC